jgi:hypothetical protein
MTRYKNDLHTPGRQTLGKPEIRYFDQATQDDYDKIQSRRRELQARLGAIKSEQASILAGLGCWVAEGCDWREYTDQLADLRAEGEALQAGIDYLSGQAGLLKRINTWLKD